MKSTTSLSRPPNPDAPFPSAPQATSKRGLRQTGAPHSLNADTAMLTVLLIFLMIIDVLAIALTWLWRRTDWAALDEANSAFIDSDGSHSYYDQDR